MVHFITVPILNRGFLSIVQLLYLYINILDMLGAHSKTVLKRKFQHILEPCSAASFNNRDKRKTVDFFMVLRNNY